MNIDKYIFLFFFVMKVENSNNKFHYNVSKW